VPNKEHSAGSALARLHDHRCDHRRCRLARHASVSTRMLQSIGYDLVRWRVPEGSKFFDRSYDQANM